MEDNITYYYISIDFMDDGYDGFAFKSDRVIFIGKFDTAFI